MSTTRVKEAIGRAFKARADFVSLPGSELDADRRVMAAMLCRNIKEFDRRIRNRRNLHSGPRRLHCRNSLDTVDLVEYSRTETSAEFGVERRVTKRRKI